MGGRGSGRMMFNSASLSSTIPMGGILVSGASLAPQSCGRSAPLGQAPLRAGDEDTEAYCAEVDRFQWARAGKRASDSRGILELSHVLAPNRHPLRRKIVL